MRVTNVKRFPIHQSLTDGTPLHLFPLGSGDNYAEITEEQTKDPVIVSLAKLQYIQVETHANVPVTEENHDEEGVSE